MYHKSFKHISRLDKKNKQTPIPYKNLYKKICYAQPKKRINFKKCTFKKSLKNFSIKIIQKFATLGLN